MGLFEQWGNKPVPFTRFENSGLGITGEYIAGKPLDTRSMLPVFGASHIVIMVKYQLGMFLQKGDIIATGKSPEQIDRIHRITDIGNGIVKTKGDNNLWADKPSQLSDIQYVVVGIKY